MTTHGFSRRSASAGMVSPSLPKEYRDFFEPHRLEVIEVITMPEYFAKNYVKACEEHRAKQGEAKQ